MESIEFRDDKPLTKQLRAAARSGKGTFLLMTFKEVFENITAGEGQRNRLWGGTRGGRR